MVLYSLGMEPRVSAAEHPYSSGVANTSATQDGRRLLLPPVTTNHTNRLVSAGSNFRHRGPLAAVGLFLSSRSCCSRSENGGGLAFVYGHSSRAAYLSEKAVPGREPVVRAKTGTESALGNTSEGGHAAPTAAAFTQRMHRLEAQIQALFKIINARATGWLPTRVMRITEHRRKRIVLNKESSKHRGSRYEETMRSGELVISFPSTEPRRPRCSNSLTVRRVATDFERPLVTRWFNFPTRVVPTQTILASFILRPSTVFEFVPPYDPLVHQSPFELHGFAK